MNTSTQDMDAWRELRPMSKTLDRYGEEIRQCAISYRGQELRVSAFEFASEDSAPLDGPDAKSFELVVEGLSVAELAPVWSAEADMRWLIEQARDAGTLDDACCEDPPVRFAA